MSNEPNCKSKKDCLKCQIEHKFPHPFCCLYECGLHDFCKNCVNNGKGLIRQSVKR